MRFLNFLRFLPVPLALACISHPAHATEQSPARATILPGELPVQQFDLRRGGGTNWHSCRYVTIGPGIGPDDIELTYVKHNSFKIAIKGTDDAVLCGAFYTPAMRRWAHQALIRFFDATRWNFEEIDRQTNLRALATPPEPK